MENENKIVHYSIGEVSNILEVKESTLRYWEKEFDQLKPKRSDSNRRVYSNDDIELIKKIMHLLVDLKYTIAGAKEELEKDNTFAGNIYESEKTEEISLTEVLTEAKEEKRKDYNKIRLELEGILDMLDEDE